MLKDLTYLQMLTVYVLLLSVVVWVLTSLRTLLVRRRRNKANTTVVSNEYNDLRHMAELEEELTESDDE